MNDFFLASATKEIFWWLPVSSSFDKNMFSNGQYLRLFFTVNSFKMIYTTVKRRVNY